MELTWGKKKTTGFKYRSQGWGCGSEEDSMPVIHKALGLIYSNMRKISNLQPGPEAHTPVILLLEVGR